MYYQIKSQKENIESLMQLSKSLGKKSRNHVFNLILRKKKGHFVGAFVSEIPSSVFKTINGNKGRFSFDDLFFSVGEVLEYFKTLREDFIFTEALLELENLRKYKKVKGLK